jgi:hypothetical protein
MPTPIRRAAWFMGAIAGVLAGPCATAAAAAAPAAAPAASPPIDLLRFGDAGSEQAHGLRAVKSSVKAGAMGQSARVFLPLARDDWRGGEAWFKLRVQGAGQNYLSVRMWGEDVNANQATLYCDGKQLGYRQLSDVDILDQGGKYPAAPGRFHYVTHPLPLALTKGKDEISCRLRATGPIWRYGSDFARFQKPMSEPSRPFYALIVHREAMVPEDAVEGRAPAARTAAPPPGGGAGEAVLATVRQRVDAQVRQLWSRKQPASQLEIAFLAKTYNTPWSEGYRQSRSLDAIVSGLDALWASYQQNPRIAYYDKATPNEGWFGFGLVGEALQATAAQLQAELDGEVRAAAGGTVTRRHALETMFADSLDWNKRNRRLYTNQSMIKDLFGIWYNNEGLAAIGSAKAQPRASLLPLFYQSMGLEPWAGSLNEKGEFTYAVAEADAKFSVPRNYFETTGKGLTKELGYVGGYGEVLDWAAKIYEATRPAPGQPGDARIRAQLVAIARARSWFRYPHWDAAGQRAMRLEAAVGWRDLYAPSDVMYAQKPSWDASPLQVAVATGDPYLVGYAQQMLDERQFFPSVAHMLETNTLRATLGMVDVIAEYEAMRALPRQPHRLPMSEGQPDFVFADEENGVLALKHGGEVLYASLYWRANYGISGLARVHYVTPVTDRIATVALDRQEYQPSGLYFTRPDNPHINGTRFSIRYPDDGSVWTAGERQPVARLPSGSVYMPGEDNAYAGRADYYQLRYGPYLIAMNSSSDQTFELRLPARARPLKELASGAAVPAGAGAWRVSPRSTAVFYLGDE